MSNVGWADLPPWALAVLGVLGLVQISLQILALVSAFRTPEERLATGKRWVWIVIVVFGQLVGAIVYFAAARRPPVQQDPLSGRPGSDASARAKAQQAADLLYGTPSDAKERRDRR